MQGGEQLGTQLISGVGERCSRGDGSFSARPAVWLRDMKRNALHHTGWCVQSTTPG